MRSLLIYFLTAALAVGLSYVGLSVVASDQSGEQIELNLMLVEVQEREEYWRSRRPDRFSYILQQSSGYGPAPRKIRVTVEGDSRHYRYSDRAGLTVEDIPEQEVSIEDIFDRAKFALTANSEFPVKVTIKIDDEYGFPALALFDFDHCSDCDEQFTITDFEEFQ